MAPSGGCDEIVPRCSEPGMLDRNGGLKASDAAFDATGVDFESSTISRFLIGGFVVACT